METKQKLILQLTKPNTKRTGVNNANNRRYITHILMQIQGYPWNLSSKLICGDQQNQQNRLNMKCVSILI